MALTPKQKIFADEYLIDLNATRAYKVAYSSCKKDEAAAVNGSKLLRNTKVAEYIQERMKERSKRTEITPVSYTHLGGWMVTMRLEDWIKQYREWDSGRMLER